MKQVKKFKKSTEKVKTTVMLDKSIKKLAQVFAIQNEMTLQEVIEASLSNMLTK